MSATDAVEVADELSPLIRTLERFASFARPAYSRAKGSPLLLRMMARVGMERKVYLHTFEISMDDLFD